MVSSNSVESLPLDVATHIAIETGQKTATASAASYIPTVDQQLTGADGVNNVTSERSSSSLQQPAKRSSGPQLRLLPPTAFMSRPDGTPILDAKTDCAPAFEQERDADTSDAQVPCASKVKDSDDFAYSCNGLSENGQTSELLYIHRTLRTFADNKDKLKYVEVSA